MRMRKKWSDSRKTKRLILTTLKNVVVIEASESKDRIEWKVLDEIYLREEFGKKRSGQL
jgi:hypothetical protein